MRLLSGSCAALILLLTAVPLLGADAGARSTKGDAGAPLPGHPAVDPPKSDDDELPPGHPQTGKAAPLRAENQLPEDTSDVDDSLPPGVIAIEICDRFDKPVPRAEVTLGILQQSVAKGESRRRTQRQADENGQVRFDGLEFGGGVAYRVTVPTPVEGTAETATYAAMPFQLDLHHGQRVKLHVYPTTSRIEEAMVGIQGIVYVELKDDVLQFDELFQVYNLGAVTWVPKDVTITLPKGFKAFTTQKEMSDTGFEEVPGRGAKMRGTFAPGQHETHFRYQIPYEGGESVAIGLSLPPHVARMRVMAEASSTMTLEASGFPGAVQDKNQRGQRILLTERQIKPGDQPLAQLHMSLQNIPTEGSAKWVTVSIASMTVTLGLYLAFEQERESHRAKKNSQGKNKKGKDKGGGGADNDPERERARARLVDEIAALERARVTGEVGPKAYARIREALLDSLARLLGPVSS